MSTETCEINIDEGLIAEALKYQVNPSPNPRRMVVAMSGGVDSSVAAWLLKEAGHEVIGVSLRLAPDDQASIQKRQGRCCSIDDMTDARQVCERLGIPFYAVDSRERFKEVVFDPFVRAYQKGITPIPCLACNHEVKFGDLYKTAQSLGAGLATGHYARVVDYRGVRTLGRPSDRSRDQTYYLYGTHPEVVANLELPLGNLEKPMIRALAKRIGLRVFAKPDSHEICFVPDGDHARVVEKALGPLPSGDLIGIGNARTVKHPGIHHFTIGQRRGIGVGFGERAYVADIDATTNTVRLGSQKDLECTRVRIEKALPLVSTELWPKEVQVQIRARGTATRANWSLHPDNKIEFHFLEPVQAVALGQAGVVYDGDVLLGGGILSGRLDGAYPRKADLSA